MARNLTSEVSEFVTTILNQVGNGGLLSYHRVFYRFLTA